MKIAMILCGRVLSIIMCAIAVYHSLGLEQYDRAAYLMALAVFLHLVAKDLES